MENRKEFFDHLLTEHHAIFHREVICSVVILLREAMRLTLFYLLQLRVDQTNKGGRLQCFICKDEQCDFRLECYWSRGTELWSVRRTGNSCSAPTQVVMKACRFLLLSGCSRNLRRAPMATSAQLQHQGMQNYGFKVSQKTVLKNRRLVLGQTKPDCDRAIGRAAAVLKAFCDKDPGTAME